MGTCDYCGSQFQKTRATRKYCTNRCKTNACLDRKPCRIRAAEVQELYRLLDMEFESADALRERLREPSPHLRMVKLSAGARAVASPACRSLVGALRRNLKDLASVKVLLQRLSVYRRPLRVLLSLRHRRCRPAASM